MCKILIIDDEPDAARAMQMLLAGAGMKADIALSGEEGLGKIGKHEIVLLDLMMPKMSGKEVLAKMKERRLAVKVIIVSALSMPDSMRQEFASIYPGVDFVSKAEIVEELVAKIKTTLKKK